VAETVGVERRRQVEVATERLAAEKGSAVIGGGVEHRLRHRAAQGSEAREVVGSSGRPAICERRRNRFAWSGFCRRGHDKPQTTREGSA
jgi:hypothetical protein